LRNPNNTVTTGIHLLAEADSMKIIDTRVMHVAIARKLPDNEAILKLPDYKLLI
jgi:hypothetical protein